MVAPDNRSASEFRLGCLRREEAMKTSGKEKTKLWGDLLSIPLDGARSKHTQFNYVRLEAKETPVPDEVFFSPLYRTYVAGTLCYLCLRSEPEKIGGP